MITELQSFAYDICDSFYKRVAAAPFFVSGGWTVRPFKTWPVLPEALPYVGVYLGDEEMVSDGDYNATTIGFTHTARVCFSIVVVNSDPAVAQQRADAAYWQVMSTIYTDAKLWNMLSTNNSEGVILEGQMRGRVRRNTGMYNNETPFCEVGYEASIVHRSEWFPDITDTLDSIHVITGIKLSETQADRDKRQQVQTVYELNLPQKKRP